MPWRFRAEKSFKRRLKRKSPDQQAAILECILRLDENTRASGLHTHRVQGTEGVWEAYVDAGNRLTFHYEAGAIVVRNHCNHDMLTRDP